MNKILCSSGAIIGKVNNNDYTLLKEYAPRLNGAFPDFEI